MPVREPTGPGRPAQGCGADPAAGPGLSHDDLEGVGFDVQGQGLDPAHRHAVELEGQGPVQRHLEVGGTALADARMGQMGAVLDAAGAP